MQHEELIAGMAAGLAQDALLHPFDTLRARLDTGMSTSAASRASSSAGALLLEARAVSMVDGMHGLYRGYTFCLLASLPANALYFGTYRASRRVLQPVTDAGMLPAAGRDFASGLGAECVASLVWTPLDVVKQRMQVAPRGLGAVRAAQEACGAVGIQGLWRGYFAGLAVSTLTSLFIAPMRLRTCAHGGSSILHYCKTRKQPGGWLRL